MRLYGLLAAGSCRPCKIYMMRVPCRGGVPLVFPQYGRASGVAAFAGVGSGAVPSHGFLSRLHWTLVETGVSPPHAPDPAPTAVFAAEWDDDTYAMWPHRFGAIYTVRSGQLSLGFGVWGWLIGFDFVSGCVLGCAPCFSVNRQCLGSWVPYVLPLQGSASCRGEVWARR